MFDKYGRRLGLNARNLLRNLLREARTLAKLNRVIIVRISPSIIREVVKLVLKHNIYAADALQVVSAVKSSSTKFVTGIRD